MRRKANRWLMRDHFTLRDLPGWLVRNTLCRLGWHTGKRVRKFDAGRLPLLCRHCRLIVGRWTP